jgi:hypothetical protein
MRRGCRGRKADQVRAGRELGGNTKADRFARLKAFQYSVADDVNDSWPADDDSDPSADESESDYDSEPSANESDAPAKDSEPSADYSDAPANDTGCLLLKAD